MESDQAATDKLAKITKGAYLIIEIRLFRI